MPDQALKQDSSSLSLTVLHCPVDNSPGRADIAHPVLRVLR